MPKIKQSQSQKVLSIIIATISLILFLLFLLSLIAFFGFVSSIGRGTPIGPPPTLDILYAIGAIILFMLLFIESLIIIIKKKEGKTIKWGSIISIIGFIATVSEVMGIIIGFSMLGPLIIIIGVIVTFIGLIVTRNK